VGLEFQRSTFRAVPELRQSAPYRSTYPNPRQPPTQALLPTGTVALGSRLLGPPDRPFVFGSYAWHQSRRASASSPSALSRSAVGKPCLSEDGRSPQVVTYSTRAHSDQPVRNRSGELSGWEVIGAMRNSSRLLEQVSNADRERRMGDDAEARRD